MKTYKTLIWVMFVGFAMSCEEHVIEFDAKDATGKAEFQLHYFVPVATGASNDIYRVEVDGKVVASSPTATLSTYNAIPSGGVGRFYTVDPGAVNIKMYKGPDLTPVYDKDVTLSAGKQNVFVHDFDEVPVVIDNGYPYESNVTFDTDSATWVKFYNFLYETDGTPTPLILQYQYLDPRTGNPVNVGGPVAFGEGTVWQEVKLIKDNLNSSGSTRIDYLIKVVDNSGNVVGDLQVLNSSGAFVTYSDWWTGFIGRRVHHIFGGMRADNPRAAMRLFYAQ